MAGILSVSSAVRPSRARVQSARFCSLGLPLRLKSIITPGCFGLIRRQILQAVESFLHMHVSDKSELEDSVCGVVWTAAFPAGCQEVLACESLWPIRVWNFGEM